MPKEPLAMQILPRRIEPKPAVLELHLEPVVRKPDVVVRLRMLVRTLSTDLPLLSLGAEPTSVMATRLPLLVVNAPLSLVDGVPLPGVMMNTRTKMKALAARAVGTPDCLDGPVLHGAPRLVGVL